MGRDTDIGAIDFGDWQVAPELTQYSQRDARWRDYVYAPGYDWRGLPFTLGRWGCYLTCVTMLTSLVGYDHTPVDVVKELQKVGAMVGTYVGNPCNVPNAYPELSWEGQLDWRDDPAPLPVLKALLSGCPQIVEVEFSPGGEKPPHDQHFVLGLDLSDDGDLWIIDPWDGSETKLLERYALSHWDLSRAVYGVRRLEVRRAMIGMEK